MTFRTRYLTVGVVVADAILLILVVSRNSETVQPVDLKVVRYAKNVPVIQVSNRNDFTIFLEGVDDSLPYCRRLRLR